MARSLGVMARTPAVEDFIPSASSAAAASRFRGKPQPHVVATLMTGRFERGATTCVAEDIVNRYADSTQVTKEIAVKSFWAYLECVNRKHQFYPTDGTMPERTASFIRLQEHALCNWAMLRVMAGQKLNGVEVYVSHVRTWHQMIYDEEFGRKGAKGQAASMTSQYLKSMRRYFPTDTLAEDERREPITWDHVTMLKRYAHLRLMRDRKRDWMDAGVAVHVAFAGLFRMGELTSTNSNAFDTEEELCEDCLTFIPSFWTATKVEIRLGSTKADGSGKRDKERPRMLPVDNDESSPGKALRDLLINRLGLRRGEEPNLRKVPLFQNGRGGHLTREGVLSFIRAGLKQAGVPSSRLDKFGTHSCRIGGATRLFQLGATSDVFRHMGGWASDAFRAYVRIQQTDLMDFSRKMCR